MRTKKQQVFYHRADDSFSRTEFARQLGELVYAHEQQNGRCLIQFVCIGSDRVAGDSLGPLIGYKLKKFKNRSAQPYHVLGSLKHPVHALNLDRTLEYLEDRHPGTLVIAIDASLGSKEHVGCITLSNRPLRPGLGLNKSLPAVGQISITGIVASEAAASCLCLQNTSLALIMDLADCILSGIVSFYYDKY